MTSDQDDQVYVWVLLPGDVQPTLCGRLRISDGAAGSTIAQFVYGRSYLELRHAVALDPIRLPLAPTAFKVTSQTAGADPDVFGVIADACPDDWGRYVIARRHGPQRFPIGFLLRSQEDRVGNLCFSRELGEVPNLGEPAPAELLNDAWAVVVGLDTGRPLPPDLESRVRANTGMGGARPKLTVTDGAHQWLAKFPSHRDDRRFSQARLEAATLDLAERAGITAAKAQLHEVPATADNPGGVITLVRRFDRTKPASGEGWLRDAYVSARTVLSSEQASGARSYMGSYPQLAEQLQRWSSNPTADRRELYRRMVFNCCVSNTDDHDRNHGLLADELGTGMRLSPAFDIVPRLHNTVRRFQALAIGDDGALATVENLLSSAPRFSIPETDARSIIDQVQHAVATHWKECLRDRGMTAAELELFAPCFSELPRNEAHVDQLILARTAPAPVSGARPRP